MRTTRQIKQKQIQEKQKIRIHEINNVKPTYFKYLQIRAQQDIILAAKLCTHVSYPKWD